jgi:ADP-ribose pyrophosphatase
MCADHSSQREPTPEQISERVLHRGRTGTFGLHELRLPNGHVTTLELLQHPGASAVVPFLDATHIVLLRQYRFAVQGSLWEIPAGKLDPGEAPESCAARELHEETGYRAARLVPVGRLITAPGFTDECIHLFCAYDLEAGEAHREPSELIEVHRVSFREALRMVECGEIVDAKTIAGLHHAQRLATASGR